MSETHTDDPCDVVTSETLDGWTHCNDSSRMRKTDNGEGLEGNRGDRHQDSWLRFDNG